MAPRAVVFDIGRVLIRWDPDAFYDREIGAAARARMMAEVPLADTNLSIDAGKPWKETIYALAEAHPAWAAPIRLWHDRWIEMASPRIDHSVRLLRALRAKGVPVYALTNFGRESFAYASTQYDFFDEFDGAVVSGEHGVIKPDPAIYALAEAMAGLSGPDLIFTDDNPDNVAAALDRGWKAHLFTEPQGWADVLVAEGLLTVPEAA